METLITIPFVFWNKNIQEPEHKINCMKLDEDCLATGSVTGEICIWEMKNETYIPKILCSIGKVCTCIALTFVHGAIPELVGSYKLIASLHCDNKLRVWDRVMEGALAVLRQHYFQIIDLTNCRQSRSSFLQ